MKNKVRNSLVNGCGESARPTCSSLFVAEASVASMETSNQTGVQDINAGKIETWPSDELMASK